MGKVELVRFESADALAQAVARDWLAQLSGHQAGAFSGGRIAEKFFDALAARSCGRESAAKLKTAQYFWADERCVPPDHPESNYRLMHRHFLKPLDVPEAQVHRIKGEADPAFAACEASEALARVVKPALDFVFLGMGEDGHVASIFPGDDTEEAPSVYYRPVVAPKPPPRRITLAMHAILAAKEVWVLASGAGKEAALGKSLAGDPTTPLGQVVAGRQFTNVFTDLPA